MRCCLWCVLQMPEIKAIVNNFADDITKDVEGRVLRDDWLRTRCAHSEVALPRRASKKPEEAPKPRSEPADKPKLKKG
jgi:hypothetical protein